MTKGNLPVNSATTATAPEPAFDPRLHFRRFGDRLLSSPIKTILQTRDGYLMTWTNSFNEPSTLAITLKGELATLTFNTSRVNGHMDYCNLAAPATLFCHVSEIDSALTRLANHYSLHRPFIGTHHTAKALGLLDTVADGSVLMPVP